MPTHPPDNPRSMPAAGAAPSVAAEASGGRSETSELSGPSAAAGDPGGRADTPSAPRVRRGDARRRLLDAALAVIRTRGYAATSVEALCAAAGVTKGAFFHHFESKEALAVAAADHWAETTARLFAAAPYHEPADPLGRVLAYVDFRKALIAGDVPDFTCLVGTMVQEAYRDSPAIRQACASSIFGHAETLEADIAAAMVARGVDAGWTAASLARHTQAVLQGAFILAKASDGPAAALESCDHLRRYIALLFGAGGIAGDDDGVRGPPAPADKPGPTTKRAMTGRTMTGRKRI